MPEKLHTRKPTSGTPPINNSKSNPQFLGWQTCSFPFPLLSAGFLFQGHSLHKFHLRTPISSWLIMNHEEQFLSPGHWPFLSAQLKAALGNHCELWLQLIHFPITQRHLSATGWDSGWEFQADAEHTRAGFSAYGIMALLPEDTCTISTVAMACTQLVRDHEFSWIEYEAEEHKWASITAQVTYQFKK